MKRIFGFAALLVLMTALSSYAQSNAAPAAVPPDEFATKAQELTKDKTDRLDRLQALHTFVRDSIAQAKTQYG